jgi:hypothetical protein
VKNFRYRVYDRKQKKTRLGSIEAESAKQARAHLKKSGLKVIELSQASVIEVLSGSGSKREAQAERTDLTYQPPVLTRLQVLNLPERVQVSLLSAVAILGLVTMVFHWKTQQNSRRNTVKASARQLYHFQVEGALPDNFPGDTRFIVRFPQVPLVRRYDAAQSANDDQRFLLDIAFSTTRRPDRCEVSVESFGYETTRFSNLVFEGEPPTVSLPRIRFKETH